jgi:hypothetical protein
MEPMFDIYTIQTDGTPLLIESVECQAIARETAYHLSVLFPGESFAYVDRAEVCTNHPAIWNDAERSDAAAFAQLPLPC